mmetsp:Transcript_7920/g.16333  ORF Transcript_7920/g.16333 Transcript_7920/m.16333 type:complete len:268 (+) Transcript_7920:698-1501(+)
MLRPRRTIPPPLQRLDDGRDGPRRGLPHRCLEQPQARSDHPCRGPRCRCRRLPEGRWSPGDCHHGVRSRASRRIVEFFRHAPNRPLLRRHLRPRKHVGHGRQEHRQRQVRHRHARRTFRGLGDMRRHRRPGHCRFRSHRPGRARRGRSCHLVEHLFETHRGRRRRGRQAGQRPSRTQPRHRPGGPEAELCRKVRRHRRVHRDLRRHRPGAPGGPDPRLERGRLPVCQLRGPFHRGGRCRGPGRLRSRSQPHPSDGWNRPVHRWPQRL